MGVPGTEIAQYGIGFFAVAGMIFLGAKGIDLLNKKGSHGTITEVVENNTKAMERLTSLMEVSLARQEAKIDELVAYARRCPNQ